MSTAPADNPRAAPRWTAEMQTDLACWLGSRVLVLCVAWVSVFRVEDTTADTLARLRWVLSRRWDAEYYLRIAEQGYPNVLPSQDVATHHWGFYPLYGWLIRLFSAVTPLPADLAALVLNALSGAGCALLLGAWLRKRLPTEQATWGVLGFSFWAQSYFLTYAYAEPTYLLLLLLSLHLLDRTTRLRPSDVGLAAMLGAVIGLCRPYAIVVAAAAMVGVLWALPRGRGWLRAAVTHPNVWAGVAYGSAVLLATVYVWYGHCRVRTGLWENCVVRAWTVGWAYGTSTLPAALAHDVHAVMTQRPLEAWHAVKVWELGAWVLAVTVLVHVARNVRTYGMVPLALALLPLVTNTSFPNITSVPRYLATTPTLFLVMGRLQPLEGPRTLVLAAVVVLHIFSGWATATGVWQSF